MVFRHYVRDANGNIEFEITVNMDSNRYICTVHDGRCFHNTSLAFLFRDFKCFEEIPLHHMIWFLWHYDHAQLEDFLKRIVDSAKNESPEFAERLRNLCAEEGLEL